MLIIIDLDKYFIGRSIRTSSRHDFRFSRKPISSEVLKIFLHVTMTAVDPLRYEKRGTI